MKSALTRAVQTSRPLAPRIHVSPSTRLSSTAPPPNFYALFPATVPAGPPPKGPFSIDVRSLRQEYLRLQQQAHPDVSAFSRAPDSTLPSSAYISKAYQTLLNPLSRAQYLLQLRGIDVAEDENLKMGSDTGDQELLMEVLELRERIEEAQSEEEVEAMRQENAERVKESVCVLETAFKEEDVETAKREAVRLRYWENIGESLRQWERGKPVVLVH